jgi:transposase
VCLALVVTREGMPLGYDLFAGNRTDVTAVEQIVGTMEARYGLAQRIWVMDRAMTSEDNLSWLRETGRHYLVGRPKIELRKWADYSVIITCALRVASVRNATRVRGFAPHNSDS